MTESEREEEMKGPMYCGERAKTPASESVKNWHPPKERSFLYVIKSSRRKCPRLVKESLFEESSRNAAATTPDVTSDPNFKTQGI